MPRPNPLLLFTHLINGLVRSTTSLEVDDEAPESSALDSSWHTSSFDLAQGLQVIEHFQQQTMFPDTMPAFRLPHAARTGIG